MHCEGCESAGLLGQDKSAFQTLAKVNPSKQKQIKIRDGMACTRLDSKGGSSGARVEWKYYFKDFQDKYLRASCRIDSAEAIRWEFAPSGERQVTNITYKKTHRAIILEMFLVSVLLYITTTNAYNKTKYYLMQLLYCY